jgi:hypothetical protein
MRSTSRIHGDEITHKQEFKMAEGEKQNEVEETQQNKATSGRTKGRKWSDQETDLLIDLLEDNPCLWDVFCKEYHLRPWTILLKLPFSLLRLIHALVFPLGFFFLFVVIYKLIYYQSSYAFTLFLMCNDGS